MKCPNCNAALRRVEVKIEGAQNKAVSYQCSKCDYFSFEEKSAVKVVAELKSRETPLRLKQRVIKLSGGRLGVYLNRHVVESLNLKAGEEVQVSVPDKNHIVFRLSRASVIGKF